MSTTVLPDLDSIALYREQPIPVVLVTGFLGVGKTTFINQYLKDNNKSDIAIIVNEFGEIGVDHLILESVSDNIVLMENGCLCCAAMGNIEQALFSLLDKRERAELPRYSKVIIETSGMANPAPIIGELLSDGVKLSPYVYQGTLTLVDAETFLSSYKEHREAGLQVIYADKVLINKAKSVSQDTIDSINTVLRDLGGVDVPIEVLDSNNLEGINLEGIGASVDNLSVGFSLRGPFNFQHDKAHKGQVFSIARQSDQVIPMSELLSFVQSLVSRFAEDILRLKLLLPSSKGSAAVLIQAVKGKWFPQQALVGPEADTVTSIALVVIAKDKHKADIVAMVADRFD